MKTIPTYIGGAVLALCCGGCRVSVHPAYRLVYVEASRVEIAPRWDAVPDSSTQSLLRPYRDEVERAMAPLLGHAAEDLTAAYPESPLGNWVADVLRLSAGQLSGRAADVGLMNVYGIRAPLAKGRITFGDVYNAFPFENIPCVVELPGWRLEQLFAQIVAGRNMNISGARLEADRHGKLLRAEVGGKPIEADRLYRVATIDYLAEGNDGMHALGKAETKTYLEQTCLRDLLVEHIRHLAGNHRQLSPAVDGRITIK